jgi:hypothetical protein
MQDRQYSTCEQYGFLPISDQKSVYYWVMGGDVKCIVNGDHLLSMP